MPRKVSTPSSAFALCLKPPFQNKRVEHGQARSCTSWCAWLRKNSLLVSFYLGTWKMSICSGNSPSLWVVFGTPNRWECMARVLNRSAPDITAMAAKLKQMKQVRRPQCFLVLDEEAVSFVIEHSHCFSKKLTFSWSAFSDEFIWVQLFFLPAL